MPKVSVITRKAYGGAYCVMLSKDIATDFNFAYPTAEVAVMGPEGAVNILYRREADSAEARAGRVREYVENFANPYVAAQPRVPRRDHRAVRDAREAPDGLPAARVQEDVRFPRRSTATFRCSGRTRKRWLLLAVLAAACATDPSISIEPLAGRRGRPREGRDRLQRGGGGLPRAVSWKSGDTWTRCPIAERDREGQPAPRRPRRARARRLDAGHAGRFGRRSTSRFPPPRAPTPSGRWRRPKSCPTTFVKPPRTPRARSGRASSSPRASSASSRASPAPRSTRASRPGSGSRPSSRWGSYALIRFPVAVNGVSATRCSTPALPTPS